MDLSEFAFKLLILFLPGIICSYIVDAFTNHKERTQFQFIVNSFVYGLMAYGIFAMISSCRCDVNLGEVNFLKCLQNKDQEVSFKEIFFVCICSIFLASALTFMHTHKLHFRLFRKLKITRKFGELDVWGYLMNSEEVSWVTVRDIENNLMYDGWIQAFSDNSTEAEVLLGDVKVYKNDTGDFLYDVSSQYLSLDKSKFLIEVRKGEDQND